MFYHINGIMVYIFSAARILAISEVASVFPMPTMIGCCIHWFIMTIWLSIFQRTWFCYQSSRDTSCKIRRALEICFCAVLGLVFIFAFLTVKDGNTKYKYIFYYTLCFFENTAAVVLWSIYGKEVLQTVGWYIPLLITTCVLFFIGIVSMIIYYTYYHPKIGKISNLSLTLNGGMPSYELSPIPANLRLREKCSIGVQVDV